MGTQRVLAQAGEQDTGGQPQADCAKTQALRIAPPQHFHTRTSPTQAGTSPAPKAAIAARPQPAERPAACAARTAAASRPCRPPMLLQVGKSSPLPLLWPTGVEAECHLDREDYPRHAFVLGHGDERWRFASPRHAGIQGEAGAVEANHRQLHIPEPLVPTDNALSDRCRSRYWTFQELSSPQTQPHTNPKSPGGPFVVRVPELAPGDDGAVMHVPPIRHVEADRTEP